MLTVKIANDERLAILNEYARKHLRLTKNVLVLVLLISEEEREAYRELAKREMETTARLASHEHVEILPSEASTIDAKKSLQIKVFGKLILKTKTHVHNFGIYSYIILIREELLEAFGRKKFSAYESCDANFAELAFAWLLCHEFLHIVKAEDGIRIYDGTEKDGLREMYVLNTLPQEYWRKGTKKRLVQFRNKWS